jgi:hypothetical protein
MNWDAIGAIAELLGAIATVATLLYLAVQIRRNSAVGRATGTTAVSAQNFEWSLRIAEDADLNRIYFDGLADPAALDPSERSRFDMALGAYTTFAEQAYYLAEEGALNDDFWKTHQATLRWVVKQPGFRDYREARLPRLP